MELKDLKKEIPFKWRVQSQMFGKASCVAYIDARQVMDALDDVVGPENWQLEYYEVKGNMFCKIGINVENMEGYEAPRWVWKSDCGTESNVEKQKGEASDAFKRAAVKWGVGRFLYSLDIIKMNLKKHTNGKEYPATKDGKILFGGDELTEYINSVRNKLNK